jgi:hypothetical protein
MDAHFILDCTEESLELKINLVGCSVINESGGPGGLDLLKNSFRRRFCVQTVAQIQCFEVAHDWQRVLRVCIEAPTQCTKVIVNSATCSFIGANAQISVPHE